MATPDQPIRKDIPLPRIVRRGRKQEIAVSDAKATAMKVKSISERQNRTRSGQTMGKLQSQAQEDFKAHPLQDRSAARRNRLELSRTTFVLGRPGADGEQRMSSLAHDTYCVTKGERCEMPEIYSRTSVPTTDEPLPPEQAFTSVSREAYVDFSDKGSQRGERKTTTRELQKTNWVTGTAPRDMKSVAQEEFVDLQHHPEYVAPRKGRGPEWERGTFKFSDPYAGDRKELMKSDAQHQFVNHYSKEQEQVRKARARARGLPETEGSFMRMEERKELAKFLRATHYNLGQPKHDDQFRTTSMDAFVHTVSGKAQPAHKVKDTQISHVLREEDTEKEPMQSLSKSTYTQPSPDGLQMSQKDRHEAFDLKKNLQSHHFQLGDDKHRMTTTYREGVKAHDVRKSQRVGVYASKDPTRSAIAGWDRTPDEMVTVSQEAFIAFDSNDACNKADAKRAADYLRSHHHALGTSHDPLETVAHRDFSKAPDISEVMIHRNALHHARMEREKAQAIILPRDVKPTYHTTSGDFNDKVVAAATKERHQHKIMVKDGKADPLDLRRTTFVLGTYQKPPSSMYKSTFTPDMHERVWGKRQVAMEEEEIVKPPILG